MTARPTGAAFHEQQVSDYPPDGFGDCEGPWVANEFISDDPAATVAALKTVAAANGWGEPSVSTGQYGTFIEYEKRIDSWTARLFIHPDEAKHEVFIEVRGQPVAYTVQPR